MTSKNLFYSGIILFTLSLSSGMIVTLWGFLQAFNSLRMNETAGIGAVGGAIGNAMIIYIIVAIAAVIGIILSIFGRLKMQRASAIKVNLS